MRRTKWKLWLDDQLDDIVDGKVVRPIPEGYTGAKSSDEAIALVDKLGPPEFMDLDHDLGGDDKAMIFLRWLSANHENPPEYRVHSANLVGEENIVSYMESWKRSLDL